MNLDSNINKIIKKLCKEILPKDVFQKGNSRIYLDDNGYYFTMIEFQPTSIKKGTFLNVGLHFLFNKDHYLSFSFSYNNDTRIGKKLIEYKNDEQFEKEVRKYVELANTYVLKYRSFRDVNYAKQYIVNELNDSDWNPYIKSMFYFLTDNQGNGKKYYEKFIREPYFKSIIEKDNYPIDITKLNKDYVINIISEQRKFWHSKSSMKKMKTIENYER